MTVKLVEVIRSGVVESVHRGDIAVVDSAGRLLYEMGDSEHLTFFRSAGKPIISIALHEYGIVEKYGLDLREIAIIASSHSGDDEHLDVIKGIMEKVGVRYEELECGEHTPTGKNAARKLVISGESPTKLHCDCSAKHIGMIAAAKAMGHPVEGYYRSEHSVQKAIKTVVSEFCGMDTGTMLRGVDGCGVPVFAMPLKNIAYAYANLCNEEFLDGKYKKSQNYVLSAMTMYPEMVGGIGRFDTDLMKNFGDRLIGKFGAEGVYCIGILKKGVGIAVKIEDGNDRGVKPAILETLIQMKVIRKDEISKMEEYLNPPVINNKGEKIGEVKAVFKLR